MYSPVPRTSTVSFTTNRAAFSRSPNGSQLDLESKSFSAVSKVRQFSSQNPDPKQGELQNQQRSEHHYLHQRRTINGRGDIYSASGYSAWRDQIVYFNCVTNHPLSFRLTNSTGFTGSMDNPNGYCRRSNSFNGDRNSQRLYHSQSSNQSQGPPPPGPGNAAQTVNHGASVYNFYFVNSGQYALSFSDNGGGSQPMGNSQGQMYSQPQQNYPTNMNPNAGLMQNMAPGFPTAGPPVGHPGMGGMYAGNANPGNYNQFQNPPPPAINPFQQAHGGMIALPQANPNAQFPGPMIPYGHGGAYPQGPNPNVDPSFYHRYRERRSHEPTLLEHSLSERSLDNYEDLYNNEDREDCRCTSSQGSFKTAPSYGFNDPRRFQ